MTRHFSLFLIVAISLFTFCSPAEEETGETDLPQNTIEISDAWARPAAEGMTGGAYLTILNGRETADTLMRVSSDIAAMAEVHESYEAENGMSGMRPAGNVTVEARSSLQMSPGGYHIMLMQMNRDLAAGDSVSLTLHFSQNGPVQIQIPVAAQQPVQE